MNEMKSDLTKLNQPFGTPKGDPRKFIYTHGKLTKDEQKLLAEKDFSKRAYRTNGDIRSFITFIHHITEKHMRKETSSAAEPMSEGDMQEIGVMVVAHSSLMRKVAAKNNSLEYDNFITTENSGILDVAAESKDVTAKSKESNINIVINDYIHGFLMPAKADKHTKTLKYLANTLENLDVRETHDDKKIDEFLSDYYKVMMANHHRKFREASSYEAYLPYHMHFIQGRKYKDLISTEYLHRLGLGTKKRKKTWGQWILRKSQKPPTKTSQTYLYNKDMRGRGGKTLRNKTYTRRRRTKMSRSRPRSLRRINRSFAR